MADWVWKIPRRWNGVSLCDRTALYPALYLRWAGHKTTISRDPAAGAWSSADVRMMLTDGPLDEDERDLMRRTAARGQTLILATQSGLTAADRDLAADFSFPFLSMTDGGPQSSDPPNPTGARLLRAPALAARQAEDLLVSSELGPAEAAATLERAGVLAAVDSIAGLESIWLALQRSGARKMLVTSDNPTMLEEARAFAGVTTLASDHPGLLAAIAGAETFVCLCPLAPPDCPRPGQWVRTALFQGTPVVAASHPSIDGLARFCVMDDLERGLTLYGRFPLERLKAVGAAQEVLARELDPDRVATAWSEAVQRPRRATPAPRRTSALPLLLALIDIHQDLDVMLPVLLALRQRGEVRLSIAVTDWLVAESPRVLNTLAGHGFSVQIHPREAVRRGDQPPLGGVDGVLCGAETTVRAHKSGHTLTTRANALGARTFTLQHGLENIGLTYKDQLHGEDVRFSALTIFTWGEPEALAPWAAPETRAAVVATGSPKTSPPPAQAVPLNQGYWTQTVGVFENLHWHRFSEPYRDRVLAELLAAADANEDTLFLIKPHHAGRWTSRNRDRLTETANLVVVDPTDSAWEPHTAPALIASVDRVLTTPSTVALDAASTGKPVAVLGYDLDLPLYEPLPIVRSFEDLAGFLADDSGEHLIRNEAFLRRTRLEGRADHRIAARIAAELAKGRTKGRRERRAAALSR